MRTVEEWAEIRRLYLAENVPIKEIARRLGLARNTVREAVRSCEPPRYVRTPRVSAVDSFEPAIRELLHAHPRMPATVIAERIGWNRGITILKDRIQELRPVYLPPDPAGRTTYRPGELAQWDLWFPAVDIPVGPDHVDRFPVIVGVPGYSRTILGRMIPSRESHDLLSGHLACLLDLGRVPRKGVYDNEGAIGRWRGGKPTLTGGFSAFAGALGMGSILCKPGDPEAKGVVERANQYLETSFLPGRSFASMADFNAQLADWLVLANNRHHRVIGCRPSDLVAEDLAAMMALPPVLPDVAFRTTVRLGRDHWVRVFGCDYSVHPRVIGRKVDIRADLTEVVVTCAGEIVARHERSFLAHRIVTDPLHDAAREEMRHRRAALKPVDTDVEIRDLDTYDQIFGVAL